MNLNNDISSFTRLLAACVMSGGKVNDTEGVDWNRVYTYAVKNDVLSLLLPAFRADGGVRAENVAVVEKRAAIDAYRETKKSVCATKLLKALQEKGVTAVVLKGLSYKVLYPYPDLRKMSDLDLLVIEGNVDDVYSVACSVGNVECTGEKDHFIIDATLNVEVATKLYPEKENSLFDEHLLNDEINFESVCKFAFYNDEFITLSPTHNVLYCAYHMFKHFVFGGIGARQMCDFALLVSKFSRDVDWEYVYEKSRNAHMQKFLYSLVRISDLLFGADVAGAYEFLCEKADDETVADVWTDMIDGGVFGVSTAERELARSIVFRSIKGMNKGDETRGIRALFPRLSYMRKEFSYVNSCPVLLPVGWVHRMGRFVFDRLFKRKKFKAISGARKSAGARLKIMKKLDI